MGKMSKFAVRARVKAQKKQSAVVRRNHLRTRAKGLAFPSRDFLRDKNISEKIWRGMKKSVLLHSLNENKGVWQRSDL